VLIADCPDCFFTRKRCRIALVRDLVDFHASGEGTRGHETLHHVAVPELVLDEVGMVRASLFEKPSEVVCAWPCLTLAAAFYHRGVLHARAACLPADAIVVVGQCLLATLLAPLLASLGAILGILGGDIG
jgi:hypothetical protein